MEDELKKLGVDVKKKYNEYRDECIKNNVPVMIYRKFVYDAYVDKVVEYAIEMSNDDNNADNDI